MTAETTVPRHVVGAAHAGVPVGHPSPVAPTQPLAFVNATAEPYLPVAPEPLATGAVPAPRRIRRITETQEIRVRTTHRRRKFVARGGVFAGFGLAMVVYPIMGNVVQSTTVAEAIPGVVLGESPTTAHALLGAGPALLPTVMEVPTAEEEASAIAATNPQYVVSNALPNCVVPSSFSSENGQLADDQLCTLWGDFRLRADAAIAFAEMNEEFTITFGRSICTESGYRSYQEQVVIKAKKGGLAASPGKSLHGFGLAVDLCRGDYSGVYGDWLDANAATFGFWNPDWAKTRLYEPWHWEYKVGVEATGAYDGGYWESDGVAVIGPDGSSLDGTEATANPSPSPTADANEVKP